MPEAFSTIRATAAVLAVQHLDIVVGRRVLKKDISFEVNQGDIVRICGANGAGKTTLLRMLVNANGKAPEATTFHIPLEMGITVSYLPQNANETLLPWLDGAQNIILGLARSERPTLMSQFVRLATRFLRCNEKPWSVADILRQFRSSAPVSNLSGGERQKLAILRSLVCGPQLLLLDEPFAELDSDAIDATTEYIKEFSQYGSVLLVTHQDVDLSYRCQVSL